MKLLGIPHPAFPKGPHPALAIHPFILLILKHDSLS